MIAGQDYFCAKETVYDIEPSNRKFKILIFYAADSLEGSSWSGVRSTQKRDGIEY
jgi:hypothetical protein